MFAQSVHNPSYRVVERCDSNLVDKVIVSTRCSVSDCRKVCKFVLASVSTKVFRASTPNVINVTNVPPYQHFNSANNVNKSVLSASDVSFLTVPKLVTVNPAMSLQVRNILMSINTIFVK